MDIYEQIVQLRREGRRGAVATIVNVRGSIPSFQTAKMLVRDDGSIVGTIGGGCVEADVWQAAREVMESREAAHPKVRLEPGSEVRHRPGLRRNAGDFRRADTASSITLCFRRRSCSVNLCQTAASAGFDVIVTDDRSSYATKERFPAAREVHALEFDEAMQKLDPNESSYIVIVTRGHRDDMRILRWAVQTRARYVGMIGSKRKVIEIFKTLQKGGHTRASLRPRACSRRARYWRVTPEEIAVAITAELIAIRRHATAALPHLSWFKTSARKAATLDVMRILTRRKKQWTKKAAASSFLIQLVPYFNSSLFQLTDFLPTFCYLPQHVPLPELRRSNPGGG